jgi:2',3'-cyclic-nucleotide 2'-phosphodiesterase (5'-nucleotidase family)
MKLTKLLYLLFAIAIFVSCSKDDGKISFTLLQVNDVYEIAAIQNHQFGGMARVETIRQDLLAKDKNTMLVIAGDFLNPSLVGTMKYEGKRISGRQMIEVMNAMDFEVAAIGNHEFDVKVNELQERMDESDFPWISANVFGKKGDSIFPFAQNIDGKNRPVKGSHIKEIIDADGTKIKIGFISVCIPSNPKDFVHYTDMFEAIQKEYETLKDQVDVVFGLTHVKVGQDEEIARLLPNIPLIMGGHEHTKKDRTIGDVIIRKADANAKSAYIHTINFDKASKTTSVSSQLQMIDTTVAYNPAVKTIVNKWQKIMDEEISNVVENPYEIIYTTEVPLEARDTPIRSVQTNLGVMIAESMKFSYDNKVDCGITNGGGIRIDDVLEGDINSVDIFRVLPYGGAVLKVEMKGSLLKEILDFGEASAGTGAYLQRSEGITLDNGTWKIDNKKIVPTKKYTVAITDFLLKGLDIPFLTPENKGIISIYQPKEDELAYDIRKGVIEYMKKL